MIKVDVTGITPSARLAEDQRLLAQATDARGPGVVKARGNRGYGGDAIRSELWRKQHEKCAYCEEFLKERVNEVDHIRPKSPDRYWWLAFTLRNLVLACRTCNNAKSNHFDLEPGTLRLTARHDPWTTVERAMLVDPTVDDPDEHLAYVHFQGMWRITSLTSRGKWTIAKLQLDRGSFLRDANRHINLAFRPTVADYADAIAAGDRDAITRAIAAMAAFTESDEPYSQLMRAVLRAVHEGTFV